MVSLISQFIQVYQTRILFNCVKQQISAKCHSLSAGEITVIDKGEAIH